MGTLVGGGWWIRTQARNAPSELEKSSVEKVRQVCVTGPGEQRGAEMLVQRQTRGARKSGLAGLLGRGWRDLRFSL